MAAAQVTNPFRPCMKRSQLLNKSHRYPSKLKPISYDTNMVIKTNRYMLLLLICACSLLDLSLYRNADQADRYDFHTTGNILVLRLRSLYACNHKTLFDRNTYYHDNAPDGLNHHIMLRYTGRPFQRQIQGIKRHKAISIGVSSCNMSDTLVVIRWKRLTSQPSANGDKLYRLMFGCEWPVCDSPINMYTPSGNSVRRSYFERMVQIRLHDLGKIGRATHKRCTVNSVNKGCRDIFSRHRHVIPPYTLPHDTCMILINLVFIFLRTSAENPDDRYTNETSVPTRDQSTGSATTNIHQSDTAGVPQPSHIWRTRQCKPRPLVERLCINFTASLVSVLRVNHGTLTWTSQPCCVCLREMTNMPVWDIHHTNNNVHLLQIAIYQVRTSAVGITLLIRVAGIISSAPHVLSYDTNSIYLRNHTLSLDIFILTYACKWCTHEPVLITMFATTICLFERKCIYMTSQSTMGMLYIHRPGIIMSASRVHCNIRVSIWQSVVSIYVTYGFDPFEDRKMSCLNADHRENTDES